MKEDDISIWSPGLHRKVSLDHLPVNAIDVAAYWKTDQKCLNDSRDVSSFLKGFETIGATVRELRVLVALSKTGALASRRMANATETGAVMAVKLPA